MSDSPAAVLYNSSAVEIATPGNPVRTDPTGTTAQPVTDNSGSLTVDQATGTNLHTVVDSGAITVSQSTASNLNANVSGTVTANAGTGPFPVSDNGGSLTVDGAFYQATQPISAAALPLPSGASTSAKQPALGTAGSPSADVLTVQGVTSMTALKVDGSSVTQPISGTVTANIGTSGSLALDATLTGGTQKAIVRGGAKGTTTAADVTSTAQSTDRQAIDVQIRTSAGAAVDTFGGGTQYADGASRGTATGTLLMVDDSTNIQSVSGDTSGRLNVNTQGAKTNNNAAPGATNIGTLPAVANAANPSFTEGNQVALSSSLNGALRTDNTSWIGSTAPTVGQKAMTNSLPVVIASDQSNVPITLSKSATATLSNVSGSASSVTLLASNTNRVGATLVNDSAALLYVKFGTTASTTSYTVRISSNGYYEVPYGYTGRIDGIWSAALGTARVTELT